MKNHFLAGMALWALSSIAVAVPAEKPCSYHYYCSVQVDGRVQPHLLTISNGECFDPSAGCHGKVGAQHISELAASVCQAEPAGQVSVERMECTAP